MMRRLGKVFRFSITVSFAAERFALLAGGRTWTKLREQDSAWA
jgi:hypothetical protein